MARVTVEDCIVHVPNRFDLVLIAAERARKIAGGANITVARNNDKNPVVALREIAEETVSSTDLQEAVIRSMQRLHHMDDQEDDLDEDVEPEYTASLAAHTAPVGEVIEEDEEDEDDADAELSEDALEEDEVEIENEDNNEGDVV